MSPNSSHLPALLRRTTYVLFFSRLLQPQNIPVSGYMHVHVCVGHYSLRGFISFYPFRKLSVCSEHLQVLQISGVTHSFFFFKI